jgi:hypothetical protein
MKYTLIKADGRKVIMEGQVAPHISDYEASCHHCGKAILFEPTIQLFEKVRELVGKPIPINSFYRCVEKQDELIRDGYKAAKTNPPHCTGAAMDLGIPKGYTARKLINAIKKAAKELGLPAPRIGSKAYGYAFVHVDLVFMLYEPYLKGKKNPAPAWVEGAEW